MRGLDETIRVLCVDDDPEVVALTRDRLEHESEQFEVLTETRAGDALDRLEQEPVDCVVSDYEMPGMDGLAFLDRVREAYPDLPFLLFTGKGSEEIASEAIGRGVTGYLQKGTGRDVYERLAARVQDAVGEYRSRASYREVFENVDVGLTVRDLETGELLAVNDRYCEMLGYDRETLMESDIADLTADVPGYDIERAREEIGRAVEAGTHTFEWPDVTADGETLWVEVSMSVAEIEGRERLLSSVRDVSERRRREREVERERDRFEALFETIPEPVVSVTIEDDDPIVRDANPAFEETFGHDRGDIVGEDLNELILPDDPDARRSAEEIDSRARSGEPVVAEVRREAADGVRTFLFRSSPVDAGEADREQFGLYVDVTEQKERERRLEQQNERLDEFASLVSHDLRNPLEIARGSARLASETCDCEGDDLDRVVEALDRMETIVDETLTLARQGAAVEEFGTVDVQALAERSWDLVTTADARLEVCDEFQVRADPGRLRNVFENLFRNSVEHGSTGNRATPDDGVEHGSTDERSGTGDAADDGGGDTTGVTVRVGLLDDGSGFYVEDDGPGLPDADVFEPGTSAANGTGFGLAIVQRVVEAHGWRVEATEGEAGGARFEVRGVEFV